MNYKKILDIIVEQLKKVLGDNLVGLYVHGSIAFGCFNFDKSDIDFIVVIKRKISLKEKMDIVKVLYDMRSNAPKKGMEMSVVLEENCRNFKYPIPFELHFSEMWVKKYEENPEHFCKTMNGEDSDLASHFKIINAVGITWYGKDIKDVFEDVPDKYFLHTVKDEINDAEDTIFIDPIYAILNLCRAAAYIKDKVILSKKQGGQWAINNLPTKFKPLIQETLECYNGDKNVDINNQEAEDFYRYIKMITE